MLLIPHRGDAADEDALPGDYRKILAIVRDALPPRRTFCACARTVMCSSTSERAS
ncbi:hypothetical protein ACFXDH_37925 [Streptomyces sp. NPDC059467]|uniref:hypothetical protein n=1 Tax=Streptomyces sp. NPDC059467 TaxID=3346844 RepID=UPI00369BABF7